MKLFLQKSKCAFLTKKTKYKNSIGIIKIVGPLQCNFNCVPIIKKESAKIFRLRKINKNNYLATMQKSVTGSTEIKKLVRSALTGKIKDR